MSRTVAFAYPGARLQARFGALLGEGAWERLERIEDFASLVNAARETSLRPWLLHLDLRSDPHQVERHLRTQFRQRVRLVATWVPAEWRRAVSLIRELPDLPARSHLQRGGTVHAWLADDPALAPVIAALAASGPPPPKAAAVPRDPAAEWLAGWRRLWPCMPAAERAALEDAIGRLERAGRATLESREPMRAQLRRLFRRHTRAPAAAVIYLALLWLELVRLRGALLRRRLALPLEGAAA